MSCMCVCVFPLTVVSCPSHPLDPFPTRSESQSTMHEFDPQGAGLIGCGWMDWAPGNFATVNSRTGAIRVWNVSQRQPQRTVTTVGTGFIGFRNIPFSNRFVASFQDGSVGVYDLRKRQLEFVTKPGHKDTVFR